MFSFFGGCGRFEQTFCEASVVKLLSCSHNNILYNFMGVQHQNNRTWAYCSFYMLFLELHLLLLLLLLVHLSSAPLHFSLQPNINIPPAGLPQCFSVLKQIEWICCSSNSSSFSVDMINSSRRKRPGFAQWTLSWIHLGLLLLKVVGWGQFRLLTLLDANALEPRSISFHTSSHCSPTRPVLQSGSERRMRCP